MQEHPRTILLEESHTLHKLPEVILYSNRHTGQLVHVTPYELYSIFKRNTVMVHPFGLLTAFMVCIQSMRTGGVFPASIVQWPESIYT